MRRCVSKFMLETIFKAGVSISAYPKARLFGCCQSLSFTNGLEERMQFHTDCCSMMVWNSEAKTATWHNRSLGSYLEGLNNPEPHFSVTWTVSETSAPLPWSCFHLPVLGCPKPYRSGTRTWDVCLELGFCPSLEDGGEPEKRSGSFIKQSQSK